MKLCTPAMMEGFFERYGWTFKSYLTSTWKTGHEDEEGNYNIVVHMTDHLIKFELSPFSDEDYDWELWPEVLSEIMELKDSLPVVKLNLSEAGDLTLSSEVLVQGFDFESFCNVIGALAEISHELRQTVFSTMMVGGLTYFEEPVYLS